MKQELSPADVKCPECGQGQLRTITRTEEFDFDLGDEIVKVRAAARVRARPLIESSTDTATPKIAANRRKKPSGSIFSVPGTKTRLVVHVITFYSFKGGVGRTMALVNVAADLVRRGRKVLVVDFDLEAPGLETYKRLRPPKPHRGIVEYVTKFRRTKEVPD